MLYLVYKVFERFDRSLLTRLEVGHPRAQSLDLTVPNSAERRARLDLLPEYLGRSAE